MSDPLSKEYKRLPKQQRYCDCTDLQMAVNPVTLDKDSENIGASSNSLSKCVFVEKIRQPIFGTLRWGGNCLAKAPGASPEAKAHGHPNKHDATDAEFRAEGRVRGDFLCQGSVDFDLLIPSLEGTPCLTLRKTL